MDLNYSLMVEVQDQATIQKLQIVLRMRGINPGLVTEDQIINIIKIHKEEIYPYLSVYERDILDRVL